MKLSSAHGSDALGDQLLKQARVLPASKGVAVAFWRNRDTLFTMALIQPPISDLS